MEVSHAMQLPTNPCPHELRPARPCVYTVAGRREAPREGVVVAYS